MTTRARKSGFTIVEMLMVIGILAALMGIVTTAASAAIRQSRDRRTAAVKQVIQTGIGAYLSQYNSWPPKNGKLQSWMENGLSGGKHVDFLSADDYDEMMTELAKKSLGSKTTSPVMDFSACVVATKTAAAKKTGRGQNFTEAIKKKKKHGSTLKLSEMVFGYITKDGYFRRYLVQYNADSDSVTVMTRGDYNTWWTASGQQGTKDWPNGYKNLD